MYSNKQLTAWHVEKYTANIKQYVNYLHRQPSRQSLTHDHNDEGDNNIPCVIQQFI